MNHIEYQCIKEQRQKIEAIKIRLEDLFGRIQKDTTILGENWITNTSQTVIESFTNLYPLFEEIVIDYQNELDFLDNVLKAYEAINVHTKAQIDEHIEIS